MRAYIVCTLYISVEIDSEYWYLFTMRDPRYIVGQREMFLRQNISRETDNIIYFRDLSRSILQRIYTYENAIISRHYANPYQQ